MIVAKLSNCETGSAFGTAGLEAAATN